MRKNLSIFIVACVATFCSLPVAMEAAGQTESNQNSNGFYIGKIREIIANDFVEKGDPVPNHAEGIDKSMPAKGLRSETFALATMPGIYDIAKGYHKEVLDELVSYTRGYVTGGYTILQFPSRYDQIKELIKTVQQSPSVTAWNEHLAQLKQNASEGFLQTLKKNSAIEFSNFIHKYYEQSDNKNPNVLVALKVIPQQKLEEDFAKFHAAAADPQRYVIDVAKQGLDIKPSEEWNTANIATALRKPENVKHKAAIDELLSDWLFSDFRKELNAAMAAAEITPPTPPATSNGTDTTPTDPNGTTVTPPTTEEEKDNPTGTNTGNDDNKWSTGTKISLVVLGCGAVLGIVGMGRVIFKYSHRPDTQKGLGFGTWVLVNLKLKKVPIIR